MSDMTNNTSIQSSYDAIVIGAGHTKGDYVYTYLDKNNRLIFERLKMEDDN